jgi:hypothetical protein
MLNLVQHPWRNVSVSRTVNVAPWTLNQVQGDDRKVNRRPRLLEPGARAYIGRFRL